MDFEVAHLKGLHFSGRAVRFVPLGPDERDEVLVQAAKAVGMDGTIMDLKRQEWKLGVLHMVKQVSAETVEDPNAADVKWKTYTPQTLEDVYTKIFTSKDHSMLMALFKMYHEVSDQEVNAIVGKVQTVSEA